MEISAKLGQIISNRKTRSVFFFLIALSALIHILTIKVDGSSRWLLRFINGSSILCFTILLLLLVALYSRAHVKRWLSFDVNPKYMVLTRVLYAILCLISGIQHFGLIGYGMEPYNFLLFKIPTPSILAYALSAIYLLGLLMLLVGYKIRLAWIVVFLFGGLIIPFSLEIFVKNIFNFYAIFISPELWKGKKADEGKWAIPVMALSVGVLMVTAGLHKALDPIWQAGLGFYYSLNIAFFPKRFLWFLLDYKWLMVVFNWATVVAEIIMLPLLFYKRTWLYANFCVLGLGLFLSLGMSGIGIMGGPIVICMFLLFLAMSTRPSQKTLAIDKLKLFNIENTKIQRSSLFNTMALGLAVFWYTVICSLDNIYLDFRQVFNAWPIAYTGYKNTKEIPKGKTGYLLKSADFVQQSMHTLQPHRYWQFNWSLALFDYHHLFDRLYFKVVFIDANGVETEHVKYFDRDGAVAWEHPLFGNEKFILTCFRMMVAITTEPYITKKKFSIQMQNEMEGLVKYSLKGENPDKYVSAIVRVIPMHQPYEFQGNFKPWSSFPWTDFFYYDMKTSHGYVLNKIPTYEYEKLKIESFQQKVIVPKFTD